MQRATLLASLAAIVAVPLLVLANAAAFDAGDVNWKEKAKKLVAAGDKNGVVTLVKSDTAQAAAWIVRTSEILVDRADENEKALNTALVDAWAATVKTDFAVKFNNYLASVTPEKKKIRVDLKRRLIAAQSDIERNREAKDALMFVQAADELEVVSGAFETEGDDYSASEAYLALAQCYDEPLRGTQADLHKAWMAWSKCAAARSRVDCMDRRQDEAVKRRDELVAKGWDKNTGGGEGKGGGRGAEPEPPAGPTDAGTTVHLPLTFDMLATPDAITRPIYQADELYPLWNVIKLEAKGSSGTFSSVKDAPALFRVGAADLRFDTDGDGKGDGATDEKIAITGNITPFKLNLGKGADSRPWGFFGVTGSDKDTYEGVTVNLSADDKQLTLYVLGAACAVGTLDGTPIRIVDDTMDGVYGTPPASFGYPGMTSNVFQPDMDSIVVGAAKRARPWSELQEIGGKWWKLEPSEGKTLDASPITVETGTLKLDFKGGTPEYVIVQGAKPLKNTYFDLVEGGAKGVSVPVGRYTLFCGNLRKGKKRQMTKIEILPGKNTPNYDVRKGETTVVTLGAPFGLDFEYKDEDGKVKITGKSVTVTGSAGELYQRAWNCVTRPEAAWRKKGTKKASKYEKMGAVLDLDGINKFGWEAMWFPLDVELDAKGAGEVEVQLVEKKHELFGKIESQWK